MRLLLLKPLYGPFSAFLMNICFFLVNALNVLFLFVVTAAGVVSSGGRKSLTRTHL